MSGSASFKLVHEELESTIQDVQKQLEVFLSEPDDIRVLENAIDQINQVRGTFVMLEDQGGALICEELGRLLTELPVQELTDPESKGRSQSEVAIQTLLMLGRYFEYLGIRQGTRPEILIPSINSIRKARGLSSLKESYFFSYEVGNILKPGPSAVFSLDGESQLKIRKYRHMYQAAFVSLHKGQRRRSALSYMQRAISQIDRIAADSPVAPLFWLTSVALEAMAVEDVPVGLNRKLTLAQIDRHIRLLVSRKEAGFQVAPPRDLVKELLYIILLTGADLDSVKQVVRLYELPALAVTDHELSEQMALLSSPGQSVMQSVSSALNEEISSVKEMVDLAARGGTSGFSARALNQALVRISDILKMVGLVSPSNVLKQQADMVGQWADNAAPSTDQLLRIADAVLYAESTIARLGKGGMVRDDENHQDEAAGAQLEDAKVALIDEATSGLATAKRSITAFIDSSGDTMNLANVKATLAGVKGALVFLGSHEAAGIVQTCAQFVESRLLSKEVTYSSDLLEHLADALSSMEFYIEAHIQDNQSDREALRVAIQAANQLKQNL